jgi:hypothetical protein
MTCRRSAVGRPVAECRQRGNASYLGVTSSPTSVAVRDVMIAYCEVLSLESGCRQTGLARYPS